MSLNSDQRRKKTSSDREAGRLTAYGETALHLATKGSLEGLLKVLAEGIALNVQDYESGYTALHKCLFQGNILMAVEILRKGPDLSIRDREGLTCIDLLYASIKIKPVNHTGIPPSMSVWTWGSNTNLNLGHSSKRVEQVDVSRSVIGNVDQKSLGYHDSQIKSAVMSKFHLSILTENSLLTNGFGGGGRLGHGSQDTCLIPTSVKGMAQVAAIASGPDHTLALDKEGRVWSWGNNQYGTLGYPCKTLQTIPSEIQFKKTIVVGIACSKYHSVCYTSTGSIYTWGTNYGQLGYISSEIPMLPKKKGVEDAIQIQLTPRRVLSFAQQVIDQISATNSATAVLFNKQVHIFCNNSVTRIFFDKYVKSVKWDARIRAAYPLKLVAGNHQFATLMSSGDVYMWSPPNNEFEDTWQQKQLPQSKPQKIWSMKTKSMAASDVAIGVESSVLISTKSGLVWYGQKRKNGSSRFIFKFIRVPGLAHIKAISASPSGSFSAIRIDVRPDICIESLSTLAKDLRYSELEEFASDFYATCGQVTLSIHLIIMCSRSPLLKSILIDKGDVPSEIRSRIHVDHNRIHFKSDSEMTVRSLLDYVYSGHKPVVATDQFYEMVKIFGMNDIYYEVPSSTFANIDLIDAFQDVRVILDDGHINCHSIFLASRCKYFKAILKNGNPWNSLILMDLMEVRVEGYKVATFRTFWKFIHSGNYELFDSIQTSTLGEWNIYMLDLLQLSTELLCDELVIICTNALIRTLTIKTCLPLLESAFIYNAKYLLQNCIDFAVSNIETFIENGELLLESNDVLLEIQRRIKELQVEKCPFLRGSGGYYERICRESRDIVIPCDEDLKVWQPLPIIESTSFTSVCSTSHSFSDARSLSQSRSFSGTRSGSQSRSFSTQLRDNSTESFLSPSSSLYPTPIISCQASPLVNSTETGFEDDLFHLDMDEKKAEVTLTPKKKKWSKFDSPKLLSAKSVAWSPVLKAVRVSSLDHPKPPQSPITVHIPNSIMDPFSLDISSPRRPFLLDTIIKQGDSGRRKSQKERKRSINLAPDPLPPSLPAASPPWKVCSPKSKSELSLLEIQKQELFKRVEVTEGHAGSFSLLSQMHSNKWGIAKQEKKSLEVIQNEQRAIEQIRNFYDVTAHGDLGEWIVVRLQKRN